MCGQHATPEQAVFSGRRKLIENSKVFIFPHVTGTCLYMPILTQKSSIRDTK